MPKPIIAAALSLTLVGAQVAQAGNPAPPPADQTVIAADTTETAVGHRLVPILALVFLAAALSNGGGAGGAVVGASDMRLKKDIVPTGREAAGLPVYSYRYLGGTKRYEGVMAQDVLSVRPEAVVVGPFGYMAVNYGILGIEMTAVD
ncbi:hypothetical protein JANAI62_28780 [Jannaschia pagri]|uniref:Peptidase S74 domain-containing protein n=1 Tax=Jannaschia pagri TaxID=2829797 RepID=A0ABQ4NPP8_9RHOB|nr:MULTISPECIES: tail fiber domain-containing protein [unclassified Jannaschia]GIT92420.1 hypothetical protein JANAI61_28780 [Jannaschia sp. AI_61]GIT96255.1 hypothetical protein JANAI62_28780 [Jannaschia sp. AI_62]